MLLESLTMLSRENLLAGIAGASLVFVSVLIIVLLAFLVFSYIFFGFAYMAIAKKTKQKHPGISWIPGVGPLIVAFNSSKNHWWPWLLIIGFFIPILEGITAMIFGIMTIYWHWKMFKSLKRPAWWAILNIIPIVQFVVVGISAWGKTTSSKRVSVKKVSRKKKLKKRR
jgi:hypothetical protein